MSKKQRVYDLVHGKEDKIGLTTVNGQVIKVRVLGLWLGNQDTSEDIFNELYTKIKLKLAFWKGRNLSLIGRVRVINIYILSRLWYRT